MPVTKNKVAHERHAGTNGTRDQNPEENGENANPVGNPAGNPDSNPVGNPAGRKETVPSGSQGRGRVREEEGSVLRTDADASQRDRKNGEAHDPKTWLFQDGLTWLAQAAGRNTSNLRSLLGRWLRDAEEDAEALRAIFRDAKGRAVAEPVAWITAAIASRGKVEEPFEDTDDFGWRKRFKAYQTHGGWPAKWGGRKPGDDPRHPTHILGELGIGDVNR